jgi:hypothetical protein
MSDVPKTDSKVPDGIASYVTTKQKEPSENGFVGFETHWEPWQKEVKYTRPKQP